ncbi:unnamed protein product [Fraxinus pennsylvanica]|uniref:Adenylate kinase n=1 Tax=Fraxinus pennsylvanica TaxID=56036 RepID=A0AAD2DMB1_9LAMI|nr:unnamed protein product [Fraxinus pennsylvanica]
MTDIDLVVNLKLPETVLVEKCLGRRICSQCGKNFNVPNINVKGENGNPDISMDPLLPTPQCVSKLITHSDDAKAIVRERLRACYEKVLVEFRNKGANHVEWAKALKEHYVPGLRNCVFEISTNA